MWEDSPRGRTVHVGGQSTWEDSPRGRTVHVGGVHGLGAYINGFISVCLPPSISLASLAASSALPHEFLLISEMVS